MKSLLVLLLFISSAAAVTEYYYRIIGKFECNERPVQGPVKIYTMEEDDFSFTNDYHYYTMTNGNLDLAAHQNDGWSGTLELSIHIPFKCNCEGTYSRAVPLRYQFDRQGPSMSNPFDMGVIELSQHC